MNEYQLKCVAIDDEPMALDIMVDYIRATPFLSLAGTFHNPMEALSFVQNKHIDLIFIDINMPGLTGLQFLRSLRTKPLCILTTAYSDYAIESYSLSVVDYLLKPIEFDRFVIACNKALRQYKLENVPLQKSIEQTQEFVQIKSGTKIFQIKLEDILFIEAAGNYAVINTITQKIMTLMSMNEISKLIPDDLFIRVHRSFIVSLKHISTAEKHQILIRDTMIPISQSYQSHFEKAFFNAK